MDAGQCPQEQHGRLDADRPRRLHQREAIEDRQHAVHDPRYRRSPTSQGTAHRGHERPDPPRGHALRAPATNAPVSASPSTRRIFICAPAALQHPPCRQRFSWVAPLRPMCLDQVVPSVCDDFLRARGGGAQRPNSAEPPSKLRGMLRAGAVNGRLATSCGFAGHPL